MAGSVPVGSTEFASASWVPAPAPSLSTLPITHRTCTPEAFSSAVALDETREHCRDAASQMHDLVGLGLGCQSQRGEELDG